MDCCGIDTVSGAPTGSGGGRSQAAELRELEIAWNEQGTRTLVAGVEQFTTTGGNLIDFTYVQAGGDVVDVSPANGLQWTADAAVNSTFTQASQTASRLLSGLGTGAGTAARSIYGILDIDVTWELRVDTYATLFTFPAVSPALNVGLFGTSGSPANASVRLASAGRSRQAGIPVWIVQGASGLNYTTAPGPTTNVTGFTVRNNCVQVHAGTWPGSGLWADLRCPICWLAARADASPSPPMQDQNTNLVHAFSTGGLASGAVIRLERTRIQARAF